LESGTGIDTAVTELGNASKSVDSQRVFYGNALNQLTAQQTYLGTETAQLAERQNAIGGADLPTVISNLTTAETAHQAALQAVGQTARIDLFDFLK
jgi:flagellin-like hook-associated protein FlgL